MFSRFCQIFDARPGAKNARGVAPIGGVRSSQDQTFFPRWNATSLLPQFGAVRDSHFTYFYPLHHGHPNVFRMCKHDGRNGFANPHGVRGVEGSFFFLIAKACGGDFGPGRAKFDFPPVCQNR